MALDLFKEFPDTSSDELLLLKPAAFTFATGALVPCESPRASPPCRPEPEVPTISALPAPSEGEILICTMGVKTELLAYSSPTLVWLLATVESSDVEPGANVALRMSPVLLNEPPLESIATLFLSGPDV